MTRLRGQAGITLTEVLVTMVVGIVVLGGGVAAFVSYLDRSAGSDRRADAQDSARQSIDQLVVHLRSAMAPGGAGTQPIEDLSDYSVVFLAPAPAPDLSSNPLGLQHVRYCLGIGTKGRTSLFRQTAPYNTGSNRNWPSPFGCPGGAWPNKLELAGYIVSSDLNRPVFSPTRDADGNVTSLSIQVAVDVDTLRDPPPTTLESSVELRNVNRSPQAAVSCQAASNGHALCDASASSDPDGQQLSYTWSMDGNSLSATSYRLDQAGLASGSSHTFKVTVTDSGGLANSATQAVQMP